ncbi:uncharacterized protein LOC133837183 [Drosophila sulfurigaster albostrigata]|uniref:uncharacterized protein LOC133837183 n=1 Tax=Drosophila sulfurigaster albostrigata TaxID=89887 RepID=UPI002D21EC0D|nr:uncharacterized protein LOC133837183 [Drosophila sulfurigaster albostrigata]
MRCTLIAVYVLLGLCLTNALDSRAFKYCDDTNKSCVTRKYGSTIPMRIYECLSEFSMLRCTKLFVLQKLEERKQLPQSGNLTKDFMDQFFGEETQLGSLIGEKYRQMSEKELNQRLVKNFQRFFKHRDIKLHFLPGMLVKIVPSKENKLKFTLKKAMKSRMGRARRRDTEEMQLNLMNLPSMSGAPSGTGTSASVENYEPEAEGDSKQQGLGAVHGGDSAGGGGMLNKRKKKQSYKMTMLQVAVPILVLPIILLGSLLPFVLPTLKMATILSLFMNNGAFLAAMLYAYASASATAANQPQHISYGYGSDGFH